MSRLEKDRSAARWVVTRTLEETATIRSAQAIVVNLPESPRRSRMLDDLAGLEASLGVDHGHARSEVARLDAAIAERKRLAREEFSAATRSLELRSPGS